MSKELKIQHRDTETENMVERLKDRKNRITYI